jgi:ornithine carbamoyltransferase
MNPMTKRDFLTVTDLSTAELTDLLALAAALKREDREGRLRTPLTGKVMGLIFHKPSLRTRVSFESGMARLGGRSLYLSNQEIGMGTREAISDIAEVLSRYLDAIMIRTFSHAWVEELAKHASIPVINGLTDSFHPCQILADLQTVLENVPDLDGRKIVFIGDGNNVARSWVNAARRLPIRVTVACPEGYAPEAEFLAAAARDAGDRVRVEHDPARAVEGADVLYTDVWASMGQEAEAEARKKVFQPFQVNAPLLARAKPEAIVLHCLPAHRGEEITDEIMRHPRSRIFDQAENRMHAQNALLVRLLAEGWR